MIHRHKPGEEFEADLDPGKEVRLVKAGFIEVVEGEPETEESRDDETPDDVRENEEPEEPWTFVDNDEINTKGGE